MDFDQHTDVIVIGAGAAGLVAALDLARRSLRVTLIEARNRTGGRVLSIDVPGSAMPAELGAEFIHGAAQVTSEWLRAAGQKAEPTGEESWVRSGGGTLRLADDDFGSANDLFAPARESPRDETVDAFLERCAAAGSSPERIALARTFVEGFDAADPAIASVRGIAEELHSGTDASSARPVGGYRPMFALLERSVVEAGVQLILSSPVRAIRWRRGEVCIDATRGDGEDTLRVRGRSAVITLPLGVLRHENGPGDVVFDPPLPSAKRAALDRLEMGHVVKSVLRFRTPFWETLGGGRLRSASFFRSLDATFPVYWTQYPLRAPFVVAWTGGPAAMALARRSPAEIESTLLDGFAGLLGEREAARSEFEGSLMHDWTSDPFARGAYSYARVDGLPARATLAEPLDGTLFFAGEATCSNGQGGTVNGAFESGVRAAREVAAALQGKGARE